MRTRTIGWFALTRGRVNRKYHIARWAHFIFADFAPRDDVSLIRCAHARKIMRRATAARRVIFGNGQCRRRRRFKFRSEIFTDGYARHIARSRAGHVPITPHASGFYISGLITSTISSSVASPLIHIKQHYSTMRPFTPRSCRTRRKLEIDRPSRLADCAARIILISIVLSSIYLLRQNHRVDVGLSTFRYRHDDSIFHDIPLPASRKRAESLAIIASRP